MQFICQGYSPGMRPSFTQMLQVEFLALPPGGFGRRKCIRATCDDIRNPLAVSLADFLQSFQASLIFNCIMQHRRDSIIFISPILQHERSDAQQMSDIRDLGALPLLRSMQLECVQASIGKPLC